MGHGQKGYEALQYCAKSLLNSLGQITLGGTSRAWYK
jgi:hypothetical protein